MSTILKSIITATGRNIVPVLNIRSYSSAAMVVAKKFVYVKRFVGEPKPTDFRLEEETLPELKDEGA